MIEALGGLLILLGTCDPDIKVLGSNGYLVDENIKTRLFEMPLTTSKEGI
ncbi:hypothetical protein [Thiolapillus sp.]